MKCKDCRFSEFGWLYILNDDLRIKDKTEGYWCSEQEDEVCPEDEPCDLFRPRRKGK